MPVKKLTPVLFVEKIESVLPFWRQHLGFIKTGEVPEGDRLAFVILQQATPRSCINPSPAWTRICQQLPPIFAKDQHFSTLR